MLSEEDDEKLKETKAFLEDTSDSKKLQKKSQPTSAFLGPQIWKKPLTLNQLAGDEDVDVENFLAENDFDFGNVSPNTKADIYEVESRGSHRENIPKTIRRSDYRYRDDTSPSESSDYSVMDTDAMSTSSSHQ